MRKSLIVTVILAVLLAGCAPAQAPVDIQPQVNTAVAQTMEAQQQIENIVAETVAAQLPESTPTTVDVIPTSTTAPTFSAIIIPTDTPLPVLPPVDEVFDTETPLPVQPAYACDVYTVSPDYQEEIKAGSKFEVKWMIVNTGTRTWAAGLDVRYSDGWKMTGPTAVEIPVQVAPGNSYTISLTATAPGQKGSQYMTWVVEGQLCFPSVLIKVK